MPACGHAVGCGVWDIPELGLTRGYGKPEVEVTIRQQGGKEKGVAYLYIYIYIYIYIDM